jgi:hypothetical protein
MYGFAVEQLNRRRIAIMLLLWCAGFALPHAAYEPVRAMFSSFVAVLDIALVFMILKGDVRLT